MDSDTKLAAWLALLPAHFVELFHRGLHFHRGRDRILMVIPVIPRSADSPVHAPGRLRYLHRRRTELLSPPHFPGRDRKGVGAFSPQTTSFQGFLYSRVSSFRASLC